jgi:FkbM family methyltransferase
MNIIFNNDNNVDISLIHHHFTYEFVKRPNNEILFRKINTYLINNSIIKNNVIDLGAWIGDNSIPWAKNLNSTIYCIDPSSENCNFINLMCDRNNINNIKTLELAIEDKEGILTTDDDITHCSFVYRKTEVDGKNKVKSSSLDILYEKKIIDNIGYIHLDVEGMEKTVLIGSKKIIDTFNPVITFEQHLDFDDYMYIVHYLKYRNYQVYLINEVLPICRTDCRNFLAIPNDKFDNKIINDINEMFGNNSLIYMNNIIYCFWTGSNIMSDNRKKCLENLKSKCECNVILVTNENLKDYILDIEPLHPSYYYLSETHRADYLRTYFMNFYGGGYSDIKETTGSWKNCYENLYNSDKWICGYKEIPGGVAYPPLSDKWDDLIGNVSYICKKNTTLTNKWYKELINLLDLKLEKLIQNPAQNPQDCNENNKNYPIEWNEILGRIFHKVIYEYLDKIMNDLPTPVFTDYR